MNRSGSSGPAVAR